MKQKIKINISVSHEFASSSLPLEAVNKKRKKKRPILSYSFDGPYKRTTFCPFVRERGHFLAFSYKRTPQ